MGDYDALEVDEREIMTVYLFTGTPGSGKSVHQAMIVYYAVKLGKPVIANYEINTEDFSYEYKADLEPISPLSYTSSNDLDFSNNFVKAGFGTRLSPDFLFRHHFRRL